METVIRAKYLQSKTARKRLGQYFTPLEVADYMANMIQPIDVPVVRILDAGAGTGVLTVSASLRSLKLAQNHVHAVLYEIDKSILSQLKMNMEYLSQIFRRHGKKFSFKIYNEDFVLSRPDKFQKKFHISSINPPYFKYNSKTSSYADVTDDLFKGNPNIYASFMAITAGCLAPNGQMVSIVPRSFASGLYFKDFRRYMNQQMSLNHIHIFQSRNKVFQKSSVLQENIICYWTKQKQKRYIKISTSKGYKDLKQIRTISYPSKQIINTLNDHKIIRIPETPESAEVIQTVEQWPSCFHKNGYFISTGPVVEYRVKKYITRSSQKSESIPLLKAHNVKPFKIHWTGHNKKDLCVKLSEESEKYLLKNQVYVILRRFSSKDEKRRLIAGVYNPKMIAGNVIAMENHINYIGKKMVHWNGLKLMVFQRFLIQRLWINIFGVYLVTHK